MNERARLLDLVDRVWDGPAWHGPSLNEALDGVTAREAATRPIAGAHTIWELAEHVVVWQEIVRRWIGGEEPTIPPVPDFPPPVATTETEWANTRERMRASRESLRAAFASFDPARYDESRGEGRVPWFALLHGALHHALYHAGQIALLKKAVRA